MMGEPSLTPPGFNETTALSVALQCEAQRALPSGEAGESEPPPTGRNLLFVEPSSPASCL